MKKLRIIFTWCSVVFIAAIIPVAAMFGWTWAGSCILFAMVFFLLMILCKQKQEEQEEFKEQEKPFHRQKPKKKD